MFARIGEITAPCGVPRSLRVTRPSSVMPTFSHFAIRRRMRLSAIRCSRKRIVHEWAMASKKAPDIRVQHPVHLLPINPGVESVQRIVLAAPWSESIREAKKILLVDGLQNVHDRLLDDFVLQTQNAEWPLGAVRLRDVCPFGRPGSIAAPMHSLVQVFQFLFERF